MKDPGLDRKLARAGAQWKDEDLDEILALLDKDYTRAEPEKAPHFPPLFGGEPIPEEPDRAVELPVREEPAEEAPAAEEQAAEETLIPTLGEQADFTEEAAPPEDPRKERIQLTALTAVAAVELAAIVAIVLWWRQWIV